MWMLDIVSDMLSYGGGHEGVGCLLMMMRHKSRADVIVGRRLRLGRQQCNVTAKGLSATLQISESQLRRHERGELRPGPDRLIKMGEALGLPLSFFFDEG